MNSNGNELWFGGPDYPPITQPSVASTFDDSHVAQEIGYQNGKARSLWALAPIASAFNADMPSGTQQVREPTGLGSVTHTDFNLSSSLDDPLFGLGLGQDVQANPLVGVLPLKSSLEPLEEWPMIGDFRRGLSNQITGDRFDSIYGNAIDFHIDPSIENTSGQFEFSNHNMLDFHRRPSDENTIGWFGPNSENILDFPFEPISAQSFPYPPSEYVVGTSHHDSAECHGSVIRVDRSDTLGSRALENSYPPQPSTPQIEPTSVTLATINGSVKSPFVTTQTNSAGILTTTKRRHSPEVEQLSKKMIYQDGLGDPQGMYLTLGKRHYTRRTLDEQERKHAVFVRDHGGACARCRRLKLKCGLAGNPYEPCTNCKNQKKSYKIPRMPCFQSEIIDSLFFRSRELEDQNFFCHDIFLLERPFFNTPLEQKREALFQLADIAEQASVIHTLKLTQDHGEEVEVYVSKFFAIEGDKTAYEWKTDKAPKRLELPPYCLTRIDGIEKNLRRYVKQTRDVYLAELFEYPPIISLTIGMAINYTMFRKESMLSRALELWSAARIIEKVWRICGEETLGIGIIDDPTFPRHNTIPITPVMDTQMDQIVIQHVLEPLRLSILKELEENVKLHKPEMFFETYLTIFILLCNIERTTMNEASFASRYGIGRRFPNLPLLESYFHSARILLSHFHFVCRGSAAIQSDWTKPEVVKFARLDGEQQEFMKQIKDHINKQENDLYLIRAKNGYERPLYWGHQLFFAGWQPGGAIRIENEV